MPKEQSSPQDNALKPKDGFQILLVAANIHAACITPLIRHSFGQDRPGVFGLVGLLAMLLYAEIRQDRAMLPYIGIWLVALAGNRLRTVWMAFRGVADHSHYNGFPWLAMALPFVKREGTARVLEPVLCFLGGQALLGVSVPLGEFVMAGALSLAVLEGVARMSISRRVIAMRNAEIEMRQLAEFYRRGGGT
jgi:hypothetical protein